MPCASNFSDNDEKFWVALGAPATEDQAGYEALTYTLVDGVKSRPELGDNAEDISEAVLGEGRICHRFGEKMVDHSTYQFRSALVMRAKHCCWQTTGLMRTYRIIWNWQTVTRHITTVCLDLCVAQKRQPLALWV